MMMVRLENQIDPEFINKENENIAENPIYMEKVEELSELIENRIGR